MASSSTTVDNLQQAVRDAVRYHSGVLMAQGIILTLLGVAALIWPQISSLAVDVFVGWILLLSGIMGLVIMFYAPNVAGFLWSLLTGALALFAGLLLLWHPVQGAASLTLVLVAFFIVEGAFQSAAAVGYRSVFPDAWGWMLASGIADFVLAALIIAGWPSSASWALGTIVGVNLITSGVAITVVSSTVRRVASFAEQAMR
jgi:uncharacterized membrane protein HdeD (DUF308 family)